MLTETDPLWFRHSAGLVLFPRYTTVAADRVLYTSESWSSRQKIYVVAGVLTRVATEMRVCGAAAGRIAQTLRPSEPHSRGGIGIFGLFDLHYLRKNLLFLLLYLHSS